jgi:hypothetical protein
MAIVFLAIIAATISFIWPYSLRRSPYPLPP